MQKIVWPMVTVVMPMVTPRLAKNISVATAGTISGTVIGNAIRPLNAPLPANRSRDAIRTAASVASVVATTDAIEAMTRELIAALTISRLAKALAYQSSEKPVHTVTVRFSLNDSTTRMMIGR